MPLGGGRPVYLDMDDDIVRSLAAQTDTQEDPTHAFVEAVRPTLYLWPERDGCLLDLHVRRLKRWQREGSLGPPPCLALLAFFSLACRSVPGTTQARTPCTLASATERLTHGFKPKPCVRAHQQGPYGIRTRAAAVRGRCPRPLDEWAARTGAV
jgi:hypothetical protein